MRKTLVVGSAIVDQRMLIDHLPKSGDDIYCSECVTEVGGCAYNVASALRNLEAPHDLCVPVGTGMYASRIQHELAHHGYKVMIHDEEEDNGYCLSLVESDGERTFITVQGAEAHFQKTWLDSIDMTPYDAIYVAGYQLTGRSGPVISQWLSEQSGKMLFLAPGPVITRIDPEIMKMLFALHPILHINDKEAREYTGESSLEKSASLLYQMTENAVVITAGKDGTFYHDSTFHQVVGQPSKVVDTVGAGDCHIGTLIGCLELGQSFEDSIRHANIAAAGIVGIHGPVMSKTIFDMTIKEKING